MAKNNTSFDKDNKWKFSKDCQPARRMTSKQTLKAIDNLICMSKDELTDIIYNDDTPYFLRIAAEKIADGDLNYVVNLRTQYNQSL